MSLHFPKSPAARVTLLYLTVGGLWVLLTDLFFVRLTDNRTLLTWFDTAKGWLLVAVTAVLIYVERRKADLKSGQLSAVVAASDDAIIGATLDGTITDWNPGAAGLYECSPRDAIRHPFAEIVMPEAPETVREMLQVVRAGRTCSRLESVRRREDGTEIDISLSMSPIRDARGEVVGVSATARDITDRKRAEMELRMAEFGKLASGLVHEIRNPLNAMRMQIAVIRRKLQRPQEENLALATAQLSRLEREVLRVTELATDFLAYGRPGPDKLEVFDVREVLRDVAEFVRPAFEQKGLTVDCDANGETAARRDQLRVRMDRGKFRQVLLNLAENARQAMTSGGRLTLATERVEGREVRVSVEDSGPGIPTDHLARVFEPFYSTKDGGTGLGLAIVKRTLESAAGRIDVVSEPDSGARFEIRLPAADGGAG